MHQVTKVLEFHLQHQSFHEYSGLISFRIDWFDLPAIQGTLKNILQHHNSKASILLRRSAFFMVQILHPYMTSGKTIALTRQTLVSQVMSLLLIHCLGLSGLSSKEQVSYNSMAAVTICNDLGAQENKVYHCFHYFPIYLPRSDETRRHDLSFLR